MPCQFERRPDSRVGIDALLRCHQHFPLQEKRDSDICTKETEWTSPPACWPEKVTQSYLRRLYKQQPPCEYPLRYGPTLSRKESVLKVWLPSSLPRAANGRAEIRRNRGIQLRQSDIRIPAICTRAQQISAPSRASWENISTETIELTIVLSTSTTSG